MEMIENGKWKNGKLKFCYQTKTEGLTILLHGRRVHCILIALCCTSTPGVDRVEGRAFRQYGTSEVPTSLEDQGTCHRIFSGTQQ